MVGLAPPSSERIGLTNRGVPAAFASCPASPGPKTMVSWVRSLPVMCTVSTRSLPVRCSPTSAPPYTMARYPSRISGSRTRANTGPYASLTGFIFSTTTWPSTNRQYSASSIGIAATLPAPRTSVSAPVGSDWR